ncbi:hypothetical protein TNCV_4777131 [Trichonephila clavipes]|nr:hypothetical protein TNCV_4777131 [Trichonephila clavipes]
MLKKRWNRRKRKKDENYLSEKWFPRRVFASRSQCVCLHIVIDVARPSGRVIAYHTSTPQVWGSILGLVKVDSAFHPFIGSINGYQIILWHYILNDRQARRRFVEWAQNEIAVVPDFHKRILFSDEAHFWLNGYVNKQNGRIWSEANPQVYVETPLHPEKLTVWCALWAGGILLQKR